MKTVPRKEIKLHTISNHQLETYSHYSYDNQQFTLSKEQLEEILRRVKSYGNDSQQNDLRTIKEQLSDQSTSQKFQSQFQTCQSNEITPKTTLSTPFHKQIINEMNFQPSVNEWESNQTQQIAQETEINFNFGKLNLYKKNIHSRNNQITPKYQLINVRIAYTCTQEKLQKIFKNLNKDGIYVHKLYQSKNKGLKVTKCIF